MLTMIFELQLRFGRDANVTNVNAELMDVRDDSFLREIESVWPGHGRVHWDWRSCFAWSTSRPDSSFTVLECEHPSLPSKLQGVMWLRRRKSRLARDADCAYVELLEVAPWNRGSGVGVWPVGVNMLMHAVGKSFELGMAGRLGLHSVPEPRAIRLYERASMTRLGFDDPTNLRRQDEYFDHRGCEYYELDTQSAERFIGKERADIYRGLSQSQVFVKDESEQA